MFSEQEVREQTEKEIELMDTGWLVPLFIFSLWELERQEFPGGGGWGWWGGVAMPEGGRMIPAEGNRTKGLRNWLQLA